MCWSKVFWISLDFKWLISSPLKLVKSLLLGSNLSCQVTLCWINLIKFVARVVTYMIYTWKLSYSHLVLYFLSAWNKQCDHIGFQKTTSHIHPNHKKYTYIAKSNLTELILALLSLLDVGLKLYKGLVHRKSAFKSTIANIKQARQDDYFLHNMLCIAIFYIN